jgi:hypothetical protein
MLSVKKNLAAARFHVQSQRQHVLIRASLRMPIIRRDPAAYRQPAGCSVHFEVRRSREQTQRSVYRVKTRSRSRAVGVEECLLESQLGLRHRRCQSVDLLQPGPRRAKSKKERLAFSLKSLLQKAGNIAQHDHVVTPMTRKDPSQVLFKLQNRLTQLVHADIV